MLALGLWGEGHEETADSVNSSAEPLSEGKKQSSASRRVRQKRRGRSRWRSSGPGGPRVGVIPARGVRADLAWNDTFRAVASSQKSRREDSKLALSIEPDELLRRRRTQPLARLILFAVDISGSMAGELTTVAKNLALAALREAYLARDRVAMVAFRERAAEVLFEPTNQQELVSRAFEALPVGGTTPLAAGLALSLQVLRRQQQRRADVDLTLVLISDGRANVGSRLGYTAIISEVDASATALARFEGLRVVMLDTTAEGKNDLAARRLAQTLGAKRLELWRLSSKDWNNTDTWRRMVERLGSH